MQILQTIPELLDALASLAAILVAYFRIKTLKPKDTKPVEKDRDEEDQSKAK